jgi:hypothetical protein
VVTEIVHLASERRLGFSSLAYRSTRRKKSTDLKMADSRSRVHDRGCAEGVD